MAIIAAHPEWFDRSGNIVPRHLITEVAVVRSYTPTGNEVASWDASAGMDGSVRAYITGTKLIIVCDTLTDIPARMFFKFLALEKISGLSAVTTIGESAFVYTPKISSIDITPSKITSIGELAFRMSSAEDALDLSGVSLDVVGNMATRHKRWSADGLAAVRAVSFPRTICLDVPNPESQYSYPDIPFGKDQNGEVLSVAVGGCSALTLYHMWNAIYAGTDKQYDDFPTWFGEKLNYDGTYPDNFDLTQTNTRGQANKIGWEENGKMVVKSSAQLQYIVDELKNGFPLWARVLSPNNIGGFHACAIVGCDATTHKLAVVDSAVLDNRGVVSWVAFEDIFSEGDSTAANDAIISIDLKQPVLAPGNTWFTQGGTGVTMSSITEIEVVNSYTASGSETASWDASAKQDGSVKAYVTGTKLTLAGNGSGRVLMNPDSSFTFSAPSGSVFFSKLTQITNAGLLDTSKVVTMQRLFKKCGALTSVDVSNWNTGSVTNMEGVFDQCLVLPSVTLDNWNTSKVTAMNFMFQACVKLTGLNLSKWDVSKVVTMKGMFQSVASIGKMALTTIGDTTNWDTSSCTDMQSMFQLCSNLQSINAENWDVSKVANMATMFQSCTSLTSIGNTANWDTASCTTMAQMFHPCASIKELNLSNFDTSNVTITYKMFDGMTSLEKITLGKKFSFNGNGTGAYDAAVLPAPSSDNIPLADGSWYDHDYNAYAPADVPSKVARTYYASKFIAADDDNTMVFVKNGTLRQIAVALRHKSGKSDTLYPSEFAEEVLVLNDFSAAEGVSY